MRAPALFLTLAAMGPTALAQDSGDADRGAGNEAKDERVPQANKDADDEDPTRNIPPSQFVEQAQEHLSAMRNAMTKGLDELREARDAKDAVRLTCVNEQVAAMKGLLRVSEDAIVALQEAQSANDTERARYEFRKIYVSKHKMDDLLQAAVNCAGAESTQSDTSVELEVDPAIANVDPYYGNPDFFFDPQEAVVDGDTGMVGETDPPTVRPPVASGVT